MRLELAFHFLLRTSELLEYIDLNELGKWVCVILEIYDDLILALAYGQQILELKFHRFRSLSALAMQFRVIIVREAVKFGMKFEKFQLLYQRIQVLMSSFCLNPIPFHDRICT
jgi:hypothetical protein